jgi:cation diffusion facilitator CzcD-associated flavoprotein CzcO
MSKALKGNKHLIKTLIPTFPVGCRRLTPAVGYLESLSEKNVRVVSDKMVRILPNGVETHTGEVIEADTLICATGFDVSFCPRFPIIGRNGNLQDIWRAGSVPKAYMSCAAPGFPNFFSKSKSNSTQFSNSQN